MDGKKISGKSWGQLSKRQQYRRLSALMEANESESESEDDFSFTEACTDHNLHDRSTDDSQHNLKRELGTRFLLSAASKRFAGEILDVLRKNQDISQLVKLPKDPRSLLGI